MSLLSSRCDALGRSCLQAIPALLAWLLPIERTMRRMRSNSLTSWFFAVWAVGVVLIGGALTSFHQPFRLPEAEALSRGLGKYSPLGDGPPAWKMTHLLSGECGCSRRVMTHMLERGPASGVEEQIFLVDGGEPYLPDTDKVLTSLRSAGFPITHIADRDIPSNARFRAVPLLMVVSPEGGVAYLGGYGSAGDKDEDILDRVRAGSSVTSLPVIGCAVGNRIRKVSDPFHLKYMAANQAIESPR